MLTSLLDGSREICEQHLVFREGSLKLFQRLSDPPQEDAVLGAEVLGLVSGNPFLKKFMQS